MASENSNEHATDNSSENSGETSGQNCRPSAAQNIWVEFEPYDPSNQESAATIRFWDNPSGSNRKEWEAEPVAWRRKSHILIHRADPNFTFRAISFWGRGWDKKCIGNGDCFIDEDSKKKNKRRLTNAVRSFELNESGSAGFMGVTAVEDVVVASNLIKFFMRNCEPPINAPDECEVEGVIIEKRETFVAFQVTIEHKGRLFTSVDPECVLEPGDL